MKFHPLIHPFIQPLMALVFGMVAAGAGAAEPLKIGVSAVTAPSIEVAAAQARQQGLEVQVVEFSDWTAPNTALAAGDLDVNFFQHIPFLNNAIAQRGYRFKAIDVGMLANIGLFSKKFQALGDIAPRSRVAIYDDVTNQGRHLLFLQKLGLITLKDPSNVFSTVHDIASNPLDLQFVEIPGPQLARALDDVDVAVGAPLYFVAAGQLDVASSGLAYSGAEDVQYAMHFVVRAPQAARKGDADTDTVDPRVRAFIDIYHQSDAVRQHIHAAQGNDARLYALPWLAAK